jgi:hypothetical protein
MEKCSSSIGKRDQLLTGGPGFKPQRHLVYLSSSFNPTFKD